MRIEKQTRDKGFWVTPLIAIDTSKKSIRLWLAWLWWFWLVDFNDREGGGE